MIRERFQLAAGKDLELWGDTFRRVIDQMKTSKLQYSGDEVEAMFLREYQQGWDSLMLEWLKRRRWAKDDEGLLEMMH